MQRPTRTLAAVILLCVVNGCVTASVWGGGVFDDEDGSSSIRFSGGKPLSRSVWVNILATPFALAIDLCTCPVQAYLYGWDHHHGDDF